MQTISIRNSAAKTRKEERYVSIKASTNDFKNLVIYVLFLVSVLSCLYAVKITNLNNVLYQNTRTMARETNNMSNSYLSLFDISTGLQDDYMNLAQEYNTLYIDYQNATDSLEKMTNAMQTMEAQNVALVESNEQYHDDLLRYEKRADLFDKYEYALYDGANRTDITYEQLETAEKVCKENGIDTDLVLSMIMTESRGIETAKSSISTATGYGQFLEGTGKFVYEDLMNNGEDSYTHSIALNGTTNIEMMVNYIKYLKENNTSIYTMIEDYRGVENCTSYFNKIDSYLNEAGTSLSVINKTW